MRPALKRGRSSSCQVRIKFDGEQHFDPRVQATLFDFPGELEFSDQEDFSAGPHEIRVRPPPGFADDLSLIGSKVLLYTPCLDHVIDLTPRLNASQFDTVDAMEKKKQEEREKQQQQQQQQQQQHLNTAPNLQSRDR